MKQFITLLLLIFITSPVFADNISEIGNKDVTYSCGRIVRIGDKDVTYSCGRIVRIGDEYVTYSY